MKPLQLTVKIRNNLLYQRRKALGWSQAKLCRRLSICTTEYNVLENLKRYPWNGQRYKRGAKFSWAPIARKLARFYRVKPEELFPHVFKFIVKPFAVYELDTLDPLVFRNLMSQFALDNAEQGAEVHLINVEELQILRGAIKELDPKERFVIAGYFGLTGKSLSGYQLGDFMGISEQAVIQRKDKALHQLRQKMLAASH